MSKDPAFLFYSKDFYEGTRTMLPEERACYIDLLIYQHQNNGLIPLDLRRVLLYCNGIDLATLEATLKAKFKQTEKGYKNEKLEIITSERKEYSKKQSISGSVGAFWKKCKAILNNDEYLELRASLKGVSNIVIYDFIENLEINNKTLKGTLKALLKHIAIGNEDENENENSFKKSRSKNFIPPTVQEVTEYCQERKNYINPENFVDFYQGKNWMIGKNKMKDWKACVRTWERNNNNNSNTTSDDDNR